MTLIDEWRAFAARYELPAGVPREAFIQQGIQYLRETG
jgi:hypothetical protein